MGEVKKVEKKVVRKKVSPYPFEAELFIGATKIQIDVLNLGLTGMVAHVKSGICFVGRHYSCKLSLPPSRIPLELEAQVFKTYDRAGDLKSIKANRMVELVFVNLKDNVKSAIKSFRSSIKQKS